MFNDEKLKLSVEFTPANAVVDGVPTWESSDPSIFAMDVAPDGLSAFAVSVDGAQGVATVKFTADADLGAGVRSLEASLDVSVMNRRVEATGVAITAGTPEPK